MIFPKLDGEPDLAWKVKKPFNEFAELRDNIYREDPNSNIPNPRNDFPKKNANHHKLKFQEDSMDLIKEEDEIVCLALGDDAYCAY